MADRQALDAMLRQLPVLRDVIDLCLGPLAVMTRIECVALRRIRQRSRSGFVGVSQHFHERGLKPRLGGDSDERLVGFDPVLGPSVQREMVSAGRDLGASHVST